MKTVIAFGAFDPLHPGHIDFFRQAKAYGDRLLVIVARDSAILHGKQRPVFHPEVARQRAVQAISDVDEVRLGDADPATYHLLSSVPFDVIALGYDQTPSDAKVCALLKTIGKDHVTIVRLKAFQPDIYKSSYFRPPGKT